MDKIFAEIAFRSLALCTVLLVVICALARRGTAEHFATAGAAIPHVILFAICVCAAKYFELNIYWVAAIWASRSMLFTGIVVLIFGRLYWLEKPADWLFKVGLAGGSVVALVFGFATFFVANFWAGR